MAERPRRMRADLRRSGTSIQDNSVVHVSVDIPTVIVKGRHRRHGRFSRVRPRDECSIGMGAIVLDCAVVGTQLWAARL